MPPIRKPQQSFAAAMAKPLFAIVGIGALWLAVQLNLHNAFGRAIMAPLAADAQNKMKRHSSAERSK